MHVKTEVDLRVQYIQHVCKPFIPGCLGFLQVKQKVDPIRDFAIYVVHVDASLMDSACACVTINTDPKGGGAGGMGSGDSKSAGNGLERPLWS